MKKNGKYQTRLYLMYMRDKPGLDVFDCVCFFTTKQQNCATLAYIISSKYSIFIQNIYLYVRLSVRLCVCQYGEKRKFHRWRLKLKAVI